MLSMYLLSKLGEDSVKPPVVAVFGTHNTPWVAAKAVAAPWRDECGELPVGGGEWDAMACFDQLFMGAVLVDRL